MAEDQSKELNKANDEAQKLYQAYQEILGSSRDVASQAAELARNMGMSTIEAAAFKKAFKETTDISDKLVDNADAIMKGQKGSRDIQKDILKNDQSKSKIQKETNQLLNKIASTTKGLSEEEKNRIKLATSQKDIQNVLFQFGRDLTENQRVALDLSQAQLGVNSDNAKALQDQLQKTQEIEKKVGLTGTLLQGMSKLPLVGQFIKSEEAIVKMREAAAGGASKIQTMMVGIGSAVKDIAAGLSDPLFIITQIVNAGLQFDKTVTQLEKNLGATRAEAYGLRQNFSQIAADSDNLAITSQDVGKAFSALNTQFGTASSVLRDDIVEETATLVKLTGMSEKSAANFAKFANISGKNMKNVVKEARAAVVAAEQEAGVRLDINQVLDQAGKIGGQISAQLGGNPEKLAAAVAKAKQFGMELEQVAATGKALLNFEESISSELEAELLTGKQLNLERARLAALTGDFETLTEEINKNVGDFGDFTKMNVLQQDALAKSLGMTTDQLSDQLLAKANLEELAQEARDAGDEDLAKQLEARSAQESFNDAVMKLKGLFVDLVGGPVGEFVNLLTYALEPINMMVSGLMGIFDLFGENNRELTVMESILGTVAAAFIAIKGTMMAIKAVQIATNVLRGISLGLQVASGKAEAKNILLMNKGLGKNIALAAAKIFGTFTKIPFGLGIPLAIAAIAGMAALVYKLSSKKADDAIFEGGGYGKRALLEEGSVTLFNNKDTIIAGTNLQKANDFRSSPDSGENTATPVEPQPVVAKVTVENRADSFGMHDQSAHNGFYQGSARADSGFN